MYQPHRSNIRIASIVIGAFLVLVLPTVAVAHTELSTSVPATGATVESPFDDPIVLTFTEALASGSKAELRGPDGAVIATATVDGPGARMTITPTTVLAPATYEVTWTGIAGDGHVERGTVAFTVAPAPPSPSPSPTPTPASTPSSVPATPSVEPAPSEDPTPSAEPSPTASESTGGGDVVLPIIVALVVVAAGAVYLLGRRNRPTLG